MTEAVQVDGEASRCSVSCGKLGPSLWKMCCPVPVVPRSYLPTAHIMKLRKYTNSNLSRILFEHCVDACLIEMISCGWLWQRAIGAKCWNDLGQICHLIAPRSPPRPLVCAGRGYPVPPIETQSGHSIQEECQFSHFCKGHKSMPPTPSDPQDARPWGPCQQP